MCSPFSDPFSQSCTAANACQRGMAPHIPPHLPRVRLILPDQTKEDEDVDMEVDELEGNDYVPVSNYVFFLSFFLTAFTSPLGPRSLLPSLGRLSSKLPSHRSTRVAHCCMGAALQSARPTIHSSRQAHHSSSTYPWRKYQMMCLR